ncbi:hypothetical protein IE53DRAFT_250570 [Violaceomyces palustris]|uniref:Uncharacterized protein n=1 Tax=Violaceomyces palustris TaxID=1673888 RepID=A0ACD0P455_9BASI|nr:hypothetical protein IE53DRAFT_250570 [Violaceomyces palustris]
MSDQPEQQEQPLFDPSLKKKSKKKTFDLDELDAPAPASESQPAPAPDAAAADDDLFGGMKKKKNKKKINLDDLDLGGDEPESSAAQESAPAPSASAIDGDLDFAEMKKKKKGSKKKAAFDLEAFEKELGENGDGEGTATPAGGDEEDLGENPFAQDEGDAAGEDKDDQPEAWQGTDRDYTYQELLNRIFKTLRAQNPALSGEKKKFTMVPPQVARDGSKKTVFANVVDICKRMHRQPDHVIQYLFSELGTLGSIDGTQRLIIKGRFQPKQIENVLRRYITEYVICKTCKRPETLLTKENRIFFVTCEKCGSQRSVSAIKTGFQAQTGKRSKTRS